ncbi:MAG: hypothetical protein NZ890_00635 [Myxococcota bacterium]|nr:hypothetical protein [Myxococcota bacterium]
MRPVRRFMGEQSLFNAFLGMQVDTPEAGRARVPVPFRPELVGDPFRPALRGGLISSLVDAAGGATAWTTVEPTDPTSTIDLRGTTFCWAGWRHSSWRHG